MGVRLKEDVAMYELRCEQKICAPLDEVFDFFKRPENLGLLTPPHLRFEITSAPLESIESGSVIDYRLQLLGIPFNWKTLITDFLDRREFTDIQQSGPYKSWVHQHRFAACNDGTMMTDVLRYSLPFGILGKIVHLIFVRRQVHQIFEFRRAQIARIWPSVTD
jgi:ligand-binding SRPBCC domain-containing protein